TQVFTNYTTNWSSNTVWSQKSTSVTTTDNVASKSAATSYTYSYLLAPAPPFFYGSMPTQIPVESSVSYYDWGSPGTLLRTVNKGWYSPVLLKCELQTLENNTSLVSGAFYTYTSAQMTGKKEFEFGQITSPASVCDNSPNLPAGLPTPARETAI